MGYVLLFELAQVVLNFCFLQSLDFCKYPACRQHMGYAFGLFTKTVRRINLDKEYQNFLARGNKYM